MENTLPPEVIESIQAMQSYDKEFAGRNLSIVREKSWGKLHDVYEGAPCEWSKAQGATHTLFCGVGLGKGTRPAKLSKTRLYVGIDEDAAGNVVWEKWEVTLKDFYVRA